MKFLVDQSLDVTPLKTTGQFHAELRAFALRVNSSADETRMNRTQRASLRGRILAFRAEQFLSVKPEMRATLSCLRGIGFEASVLASLAGALRMGKSPIRNSESLHERLVESPHTKNCKA